MADPRVKVKLTVKNKMKLDQPSLFDSVIDPDHVLAISVAASGPVSGASVVYDRVPPAWEFTCQGCLGGEHDCEMPFCRCLTCGGGFRG